MASRRLFSAVSPSVDALASLCSRTPTASEYPLATSIESKIPIYKLPAYESTSQPDLSALQDEWYAVLKDGPGVLVLQNMYGADPSPVIDAASRAYRTILDDEQRRGTAAGDHFAASGLNERIWNSLGKHAVADPASFTSYYSNPWVGLVCTAWLGPGYRVTAQMNSVKPGGKPQECHRDYHLGFQGPESARRWPRGVHTASQLLTLQGAVAHVDVPLASGPTRLLPYSQRLEEGYTVYREGPFQDYFAREWVALPLRKGDGLFFNPGLFHAAGENRSTDVQRMVNLLQISSAFGRPMEAVDTVGVVQACWGDVTRLYREGGGPGAQVGADGRDRMQALVSSMADGYPFPTNLDRNAPAPGQMTPPSEQDVLWACLEEGCGTEETVERLRGLEGRSRA